MLAGSISLKLSLEKRVASDARSMALIDDEDDDDESDDYEDEDDATFPRPANCCY